MRLSPKLVEERVLDRRLSKKGFITRGSDPMLDASRTIWIRRSCDDTAAEKGEDDP
jgi:hypothetical protein